MLFLIPLSWWLLFLCEEAQGVVLDPALFLAPSPPLRPSRYAPSAVEMWTETLEDRVAREAEDVSVVPLKRIKPTTNTQEPAQQTTEDLAGETIEAALLDSQIPSKKYNTNPVINDARSSYYGLGGIHIPLTFSISGSYGQYGVRRPSLVASNYATAADTSDSLMGLFGNGYSGKPALAGSSYNYNSMGSVNPLLRVYGSGGSGPSWSGWGNGKWGHYGKG